MLAAKVGSIRCQQALTEGKAVEFDAGHHERVCPYVLQLRLCMDPTSIRQEQQKLQQRIEHFN